MRFTYAGILGALALVSGCQSDEGEAVTGSREYTLTIQAVGDGITDPAPGVYTYQSGSEVTVKAEPAAGSIWRGWSGSASGTAERTTIRLDGNKTLNALFTLSKWPAGPAETYDNPILPGDHADLNVFEDDGHFYVGGSNFGMFPALEVLHSTDLIHWERMSRVVDASSPALEGQTGPGQGTWGAFFTKAPGGYRVYFSINATQWFSSAASMAGPWSEPVKVESFPVSPDGGEHEFERGTGSDNSVFVDPDSGKTYMVIKNGLGQWAGDPAVSDFGMNRLVEIDAATGQLLPETMINLDFVNWDKAKGGAGPLSDPDYSQWAEGPTLTKRGEWYYYFVQTHTACSGKSSVWASKTLDGDPANWTWLGFVMGPGDPYNGTQHPSAPFQIADGSWWVFAHSYDCTSKGSTAEEDGEWLGLGREGLLHQVSWVDTEVDGQVIPVPKFTDGTRNLPAPQIDQSGTPFLLPVNDDFSASTLGTAWTSYDRSGVNLSVGQREGWLRIQPQEDGKTVWALQKEALRSTASLTRVEFTPTAEGEAAGICVRNGFWEDSQLLSGPTWLEGEGLIVGHFDVSVARTLQDGADVIRFSFRSRTPTPTGGSGSYETLEEPVEVSYVTPAPKQAAVWLKLVRSGHQATGWYSTDRVTWKQVGQAIDIEELDDNYGMANAWVGNHAGLFATGKSADFDLFTYRDGLTPIPAVATDQQSGTAIVESSGKGPVLGELEDGDWALYGSVDLGPSTSSARIEAASPEGAYFEIWLDPLAGGPHFGPCAIGETGGWETWKTAQCDVVASGSHDVYVKLIGEPGKELARIASLQFVP